MIHRPILFEIGCRDVLPEICFKSLETLGTKLGTIHPIYDPMHNVTTMG
jgi:hypothetical protein